MPMLPPFPRVFAHAFLRAAVLPSLVAACGGSDLPSATEPVAGNGLVYTLVSVDNKDVPAAVAAGAAVFTVTRGKLTLAPDSTWIVSSLISGSGSGGAASGVTTSRGTYRRTGTALVLSQPAAEAFQGTYSDTRVTLTATGAQVIGTSFVYTR